MLMKASVGRMVHFHAPNWADQACKPGSVGPGYNGMGAGPYAAVVTQVFTDADGNVTFCNLKVLVPFATPVDVGSVPEKDTALHSTSGQSHWEWPPRS